ncbi:MAG: rhomboid family intramembrane serine protease [bacterium]
MLIPYHVDVPMERWPIANFAILGMTTLVSLWALVLPEQGWVREAILHDWSPTGLVGHVLLHGGPIHLIGNMLFLWVFGNAVCAKIGNLSFPLVYLGLGVCAAAAHLIFDGAPAVGASGAINGIVGMFLVWYPLNHISVFYWFGFYTGIFSVSSGWMIAFWLMWDIFGAATGGGGVAYWAHLGGFAGGAGLAWALLALGWIEMTRSERSLVEVMRGTT